MASAGAKPTLTPDKAKAIAKAVADGMPLLYAGLGAGVPERTLMRWLAAGRKADAGEPYRQFWQDVEKARAAALEFRLKRLKRAGAKNPKVDMWWCERMFPETFGTDKRLVNELLAEIARLRAEQGAKGADARRTGGRGGATPPAGGAAEA